MEGMKDERKERRTEGREEGRTKEKRKGICYPERLKCHVVDYEIA
jgi:hypothetical protein